MKIHVYSRETIKRIFLRKDQEAFKNCGFISINDYSTLTPTPVPEKYLSDTLVLHFDDITPREIKELSLEGYKAFSEEHAKAIHSFIDNVVSNCKTDICIHCNAGISRSGAIGIVLNEYLNRMLNNNHEDYAYFHSYGCERMLNPNPYILAIMKKEFLNNGNNI